MRTSPTKLYHKLNKQFFSNRLPRYRVVLCNFRGSLHGECLPERRLIRIDRSLESGTMRSTLLHEMCHIGCLGHRPRFQAKLMHLAKQGEEWAREQAEKYRGQPSFKQEMANLRGTLDDVAWQPPRPHPILPPPLLSPLGWFAMLSV